MLVYPYCNVEGLHRQCTFLHETYTFIHKIILRKILTVVSHLIQYARLLVEEGKRSFVPYSTPKGDHTIAVKKDAPIGGQQMYRIYLEALLINILREQSSKQPLPVFASKDDFQKTLHGQILEYLKENLGGELSLVELSQKFNYSNTFLCTKFKEQSGESIMQCYNRLKIEEACRMMQQTEVTLADISARLGFNNPYYFLRVFKRVKGVAPSEYRKRVK